MRIFLKTTLICVIIMAGVLYTRLPDKPTQLEHVLQNQQLVVVTRNAINTYYKNPTDPAGLEYDLAKMFAEQLGVNLKFIIASDREQIFEILAEGKAHFAAAGLTQTTDRHRQLRFTPPYQDIVQQLVYRQGSPRPKNIGDLGDGKLSVVAGSSHVEQLHEMHKKYPELTWEESIKFNNEELLQKVESGQISYTISNSNELMLNHHLYPHLRVAFNISEKQPIAWAFSNKHDDTLYRKAVRFFVEIYNQGVLEQLLERYYGHIREFDYVATMFFMRHIRQRLPNYRELFKTAAKNNHLDWRLLAATAYQESHWDPHAVSPTGVRGIMMLTRITAKQMGVEKRTDAAQSIHGGSRYLRLLKDLLPPEIGEPDRSWLALAAYNIGYGHLMDARKITRQSGGNPALWMDVKKKLPLLRDKIWYQNTTHGFARGDETVLYVENIRSYYQILLRKTNSISGSNNQFAPALLD